MREDGLRRAKTAALLLLPVLVMGFASGAAAFAAQDETSAALTLAKIHIVARAGGIRMGDVFWAALGQVVRIALLWLCACAGRTLLALGCGALYFEAYSFAFTVSALVVQEGFRGAMLAALHVFAAESSFVDGVYRDGRAGRCAAAAWRTCPEEGSRTRRGENMRCFCSAA